MRGFLGFGTGIGTRRALAAFALSLLCLAACDDPARPPAGSGEPECRYDAASGTIVGRLAAADDFAPLELVATQVTYDPATEQLHVRMSIRNTGAERTPAPDGILVNCFVPGEVVPLNALGVMCQSQPPSECCGGWVYLYRDAFGGDSWLDPGETSMPVEWILRDPGGGSFSFAALPWASGASPSGTVFEDANADGSLDDLEDLDFGCRPVP